MKLSDIVYYLVVYGLQYVVLLSLLVVSFGHWFWFFMILSMICYNTFLLYLESHELPWEMEFFV